MRSLIILACAFGLSGHALAMNRCVASDGKVSFSDMPCPSNQTGRAVVVRPATGYSPQAAPSKTDSVASASPSDRTASMKKYLDDATMTRKQREVEAEIIQRERAITSLVNQQEAEIARLRESKGRANNNLAGATWEQALSTEMGAVADRYRTRIEIEQNALRRLGEQLANMKR